MSETPTPSLLQDWLREKANAPYFAAYRGDLLSIAHALDSLHSALTAERAARERAELKAETYETVHSLLFERLPAAQALGELPGAVDEMRAARERAEAERDTLLARVRDDALAMTCQSIGQYRTALLAGDAGSAQGQLLPRSAH